MATSLSSAKTAILGDAESLAVRSVVGPLPGRSSSVSRGGILRLYVRSRATSRPQLRRRWTMKQLATCMAMLAVVTPAQKALSAAPFQNLDFEDAVVTGAFDGSVPASEALPYWTHNNFAEDYLPYNIFCLAPGCISIHDSGSMLAPAFPIEGEYSVLLQGGHTGVADPIMSISQLGDVPSNATAIRFLSIEFDHLRVSLNGVTIPYVELFSIGDATMLEGNISAFAGTTAELKFESVPGDGGGKDSIRSTQYSSFPSPPPSSS